MTHAERAALVAELAALNDAADLAIAGSAFGNMLDARRAEIVRVLCAPIPAPLSDTALRGLTI